MAVEYEYYSEHSGDNVDAGVNKGLNSIQSISINGTAQTKDANGNVDLPKYPDTMPWGSITGTLANQPDLNTALTNKQDKNVGSNNANKILYVNTTGDIALKDDPLTANWGNISGALNNQADLITALAGKVDKEAGKALSTNDYDNTEKAKVAKIANIESLIPTEATNSNKLADKNFVSDSVASALGNYKGLFNNFADLPTTGNLKNDYAHVNIFDESDPTEIIGYTKYKWSSETLSWLKECDVKTNNFSEAQNNAINSGATSAKITTYDNHVTNTSNPHGVTKTQVGLGNVENVGSSAIPASGGTDNFTTGGAYTELNKKADKTNTIGSHTMADNITNQNLFDDIKDLIGTFTRKVIDGASNTLSNIALSSLTNQGGANAGKPIVVGNDGTISVGDKVPTYLDISNQVSENTYNSTNGTFNHCKFCLQNDMVFYNVDYVLNNAITDKRSAIRKVMELPDLSGQFAYPSKINVRVTQAVCQPTSQEAKDAWYTSGGDAYVDPAVFSNLTFHYIQVVPILDCCFKDQAKTQPIFIARQIKDRNTGGYYWNGNKPVVITNAEKIASDITVNAQYDFDALPYTSGTGSAPSTGYYHNTSTNKWYYNGSEITVGAIDGTNDSLYYPKAEASNLNKYYTYTPVNQIGESRTPILIKGVAGRNYYVLKRYEAITNNGGYNKIDEYYDQNGTYVTLANDSMWWEVEKVNLTVSADFLYKAWLYDFNCNVSATGIWGKYSLTESLWDQFITVVSLNLNYPLNHGAFGSATFVPKPITSATDVLTQGDVINNALYVNGGLSFDRIQIGAGGIM